MTKEIPESAKRDYEEGYRLIKRAQAHDPNYQALQEKAHEEAMKALDEKAKWTKKNYGVMKKTSLFALITGAALGLTSAFEAYRGAEKLDNPSVVKTMTPKEIEELKNRVKFEQLMTLNSLGLAGCGALGAHGFRQDEKKKLREIEEKRKELSSRTYLSFAGAVCLTSALFLLSANITGNAIANLSLSNSNISGGVLFILGLTALYFTFKKEK